MKVPKAAPPWLMMSSPACSSLAFTAGSFSAAAKASCSRCRALGRGAAAQQQAVPRLRGRSPASPASAEASAPRAAPRRACRLASAIARSLPALTCGHGLRQVGEHRRSPGRRSGRRWPAHRPCRARGSCRSRPPSSAVRSRGGPTRRCRTRRRRFRPCATWAQAAMNSFRLASRHRRVHDQQMRVRCQQHQRREVASLRRRAASGRQLTAWMTKLAATSSTRVARRPARRPPLTAHRPPSPPPGLFSTSTRSARASARPRSPSVRATRSPMPPGRIRHDDAQRECAGLRRKLASAPAGGRLASSRPAAFAAAPTHRIAV
jgi:hypothetical protein